MALHGALLEAPWDPWHLAAPMLPGEPRMGFRQETERGRSDMVKSGLVGFLGIFDFQCFFKHILFIYVFVHTMDF